MMDERGFVSVQKEKEREERRKTLVGQVNTLKDAYETLKSEFIKTLKMYLRRN